MIATRWVNTDPDEGGLPALLRRMATLLPVADIDELWIFPTRRASAVESTVIVVSALDPDPERRRVFTAHFTVTRDRKGRPTVSQRLHEHATAPAAAVTRAVDGVVRRLGDDAAQPPRAESIGADLDRWDDLIRQLGGTPAPRGGDPASDAGPPVTNPGPAVIDAGPMVVEPDGPLPDRESP